MGVERGGGGPADVLACLVIGCGAGGMKDQRIGID